MSRSLAITGVGLAAVVLNLPLGYWRASVPKFSLRWFAAVHLSIPLVLALRITAGLGPLYIIETVSGAVLGQLLGGRLRRPQEERWHSRRG